MSESTKIILNHIDMALQELNDAVFFYPESSGPNIEGRQAIRELQRAKAHTQAMAKIADEQDRDVC